LAARGLDEEMARPLLIKTITSMVLISIQPFALRKIFLVIAALLCFSALCFADPVLMAQRYSSPRLDESHELERVDFPARSQQFLPGKSPSPEKGFRAGDSGFPILVISTRFAYT
jgi:hypothetical protein